MNVSNLFSELCKTFSFSFSSLKQEQESVLDLVLNKKDVIACLPTGFGKSALYVLPPLMMDLRTTVK